MRFVGGLRSILLVIESTYGFCSTDKRPWSKIPCGVLVSPTSRRSRRRGVRFDAIGTGANMALYQSGVWRGNSGNGKQRLDRRFESPVHLRQHHEKALLKTTTSTFRGTRGSKMPPAAIFCCASVAGWRGSLRRNPWRSLSCAGVWS
jgi:hypothetical protein